MVNFRNSSGSCSGLRSSSLILPVAQPSMMSHEELQYKCDPLVTALLTAEFLLKLDDIARFLVQHGEEILIQPAAESDEDGIRLFLLGSALGALLHQRGRLILKVC